MPKVVCIVDDQPSLRQMLHFALNLRGFKVLVAENGVEALAKLASHDIDMLIVNWQIPGMDGLELVRRLRNIQAYAELPIMMISNRDELAARNEACSLGVTHWLKIPFRIAEIQFAVESGLGPNTKLEQHKGSVPGSF